VSIAPIIRSVVVKAEPAQAFELFTTRMQDWWPLGKATIGRQPAVSGTDWAYHADLLTELELTFAARATGGTLVTLEHRHLERLGADAARHRDLLDGGWPTMLGEYQKLSDTN